MKKVTICGSKKFQDTWIEMYNKLTSRGYLVYLPFLGEVTSDMIDILHKVHYAKILESDIVCIIDVSDHFDTVGYVGDDTQREIDFAREHNKEIIKLSQINKENMF